MRDDMVTTKDGQGSSSGQAVIGISQLQAKIYHGNVRAFWVTQTMCRHLPACFFRIFKPCTVGPVEGGWPSKLTANAYGDLLNGYSGW